MTASKKTTKKDLADELNGIHDDYSNHFSSGLHNALWQIMINGALDQSSAEYAFTAIHKQGGLVMVVAGTDGGYLAGCHSFFEPFVSYDKASEICEELSEMVFGINADAAERIVTKSMMGTAQ